MKIAGLFPGQGSQAVGMGKAFFEQDSAAKDIFLAADDALGFSLSKLCFEGPIEELTLTKNAQPAILTASYVSFVLSGVTPDAANSSSFNWLCVVVAGCIAKLLASPIFETW